MADMNAFLQKKLDRDEELKYQVEKSFEEIQRYVWTSLHYNDVVCNLSKADTIGANISLRLYRDVRFIETLFISV